MKYLKQILIVLSAVALIACAAPYSGKLSVLEPITLTNKADQNIPLKAGTHNVEIRWKKGQAYFEFILTDNKGSKQTFRFNVPEGSKLPEGSGNLYIPTFSSKQPWDLKGEVTSKQSKTDIQTGHEPCTLQRMLTDCSSSRPVRCKQVWRTFPGKRNVEFYYITANKKLRLQITTPNTVKVAAEFNGEATDRWKVYTYRGDCFWVE